MKNKEISFLILIIFGTIALLVFLTYHFVISPINQIQSNQEAESLEEINLASLQDKEIILNIEDTMDLYGQEIPVQLIVSEGDDGMSLIFMANNISKAELFTIVSRWLKE